MCTTESLIHTYFQFQVLIIVETVKPLNCKRILLSDGERITRQ